MSRDNGGGGWGTFAAVVFSIVGIANGIQGLTALFKKEYFSESNLLFQNLQFWAWVWLIVGVLQIIAAYLLLDNARSGRTLGIVLAAGSAIVSFISMGAYPLWSIAVLTMDLLIVYGLAAHPSGYIEGSSHGPGGAGSEPRSAEPPMMR
jgi:hypothetical protein